MTGLAKGTKVILAGVILAVAPCVAMAQNNSSTPWLFSPTDPNGAIGCADQANAYVLAQTITVRGYKSWEQLKASLPEEVWDNSLAQGDCVVFTPDTQWVELSADNVIAYMRPYPWTGGPQITFFFEVGQMADPKGNHPRVSSPTVEQNPHYDEAP